MEIWLIKQEISWKTPIKSSYKIWSCCFCYRRIQGFVKDVSSSFQAHEKKKKKKMANMSLNYQWSKVFQSKSKMVNKRALNLINKRVEDLYKERIINMQKKKGLID